MIVFGIFVAVYLISVMICNILDTGGRIKGSLRINYIPFVNTFILLLCLIGGCLWWLVEYIRYGNKK